MNLKELGRIGEINYGPTKSEEKSLIFRRSIYVARDIKKGEKFTYQNLRIVRPGMGAPPYLLSTFIGKTANKSFKKVPLLTLINFFKCNSIFQNF